MAFTADLHGHVHERWKVCDKMINVCIDVRHYAPVGEEELDRRFLSRAES